jgi:ribonucleotide monophosphatase NagD (HAD superfamily)
MLVTSRVQGVLIDLAGVLHIDDQVIPGAVEALRTLRGSGLPLRFLTNTMELCNHRVAASDDSQR